MFYNTDMDAIRRLKLLTDQMHLEPAEDASSAAFSLRSARPGCFTPKQQDAIVVHPAKLPNGQSIKLLKTLLTSACERDCYYCPFRAGRDFRRATFKPDEFASLFMNLHHVGAAEGIFLSSGVAGGGVRTQDKLLDTADILRHKLGFRGYIHLKVMPGAEKAQVERAMQLADRVSVNLEAPNSERLEQLAPHKVFMEELLQPLKWVDEIRRSQPAYKGWKGRWPSTVTQYVVGGADESDLELLTTTSWLHQNVHLGRAYFSAFSPIRDTPLENKAATDPLREHRLYQASFLLRDYGFDLEELPFAGDGNLPLPTDPKLAWAQVNLSEQPIEINKAEKRELLRVPGIGPRGAEAILRARRQNKLRDLSVLKKLGVIAERAAPYVLLDGQRAPRQMPMF
jgi:predicted DNA-binding helix-hairpin-helix protein